MTSATTQRWIGLAAALLVALLIREPMPSLLGRHWPPSLAARPALAAIRPPAAGKAAPPESAAAFVDSVGVVTHLTNADTAYGDWSRLVGALGDLGVRHVRDAMYGNPEPQWAWFNSLLQSRVQLAASRGIRFLFLMGAPGWNGGSVDQLVSVLAGPLRGVADGVEAPNEWDSGAPADFGGRLSAYDRQLYTAVKSNPVVRELPVIAPSVVDPGALAQLGDQGRWADAGNAHAYSPGSPTAAFVASQIQRARVTAPGKPVWVTEMGFPDDAVGAPSAINAVSQPVAANYLLREYLQNFQGGIVRSYAYELIDDRPDPAGTNFELHLGLLNNDGSPKPAYFALKHLLAIVGHSAPSTLTPLPLTSTGTTPDTHQLVLQQTDHTYQIILWREAPIWNLTTRQPITLTPTHITLTLPTATTATTTDPLNTAPPTPLTLTHHTITTQLTGDPTIITVQTG